VSDRNSAKNAGQAYSEKSAPNYAQQMPVYEKASYKELSSQMS